MTDNGCFDPAQMGATCELVTGQQTHLSTALPDGTMCSGTAPAVLSPPATETAVCLQTIDMMFKSKCAATFQEAPCLCGATSFTVCVSGTVTPTGPLYDLYACDFNSANPATINFDFTLTSHGAGVGNFLIQCAAAFSCDCFWSP
jgi:hypothetical protein